MNILFYSKQLYRSCILIITICYSSSCAFTLFPKITKVTSDEELPPVRPDSAGKIEIVSLSTLDRYTNTSLRFENAKLTNQYGNRTFERMLQLIKNESLYKNSIFAYNGSNNNDSIYRGLLNPYFSGNFETNKSRVLFFQKNLLVVII